jgi:Tfp pilus assembly PilM family ATPase
MRSSYYVGVSFLKGKIQLAEVEHKRRKLTITVLAERATSIDFAKIGATLTADHPQLNKFAQELKEIIKQNEISAEFISFALPPDPVFINIIPVDPTMSKNELTQYLHWEVEQYFPEVSPKVFITDSHGLPVEKPGAQQTFMVSVRRGMVAFLQKVVAGLQMKLHIVDIDQFSTEKTLIVNYPEILEHDIVLFGLRDVGVDASLIHNGEMTDYRAFPYDGEQSPDHHILNYLKYLKQKNNSTPAALLLYGIEITKDLVISLRKETGIKQTLPLNVFRKVRGADKLDTPLVREGYRFAAAVGLALRGK